MLLCLLSVCGSVVSAHHFNLEISKEYYILYKNIIDLQNMEAWVFALFFTILGGGVIKFTNM